MEPIPQQPLNDLPQASDTLTIQTPEGESVLTIHSKPYNQFTQQEKDAFIAHRNRNLDVGRPQHTLQGWEDLLNKQGHDDDKGQFIFLKDTTGNIVSSGIVRLLPGATQLNSIPRSLILMSDDHTDQDLRGKGLGREVIRQKLASLQKVAARNDRTDYIWYVNADNPDQGKRYVQEAIKSDEHRTLEEDEINQVNPGTDMFVQAIGGENELMVLTTYEPSQITVNTSKGKQDIAISISTSRRISQSEPDAESFKEARDRLIALAEGTPEQRISKIFQGSNLFGLQIRGLSEDDLNSILNQNQLQRIIKQDHTLSRRIYFIPEQQKN